MYKMEKKNPHKRIIDSLIANLDTANDETYVVDLIKRLIKNDDRTLEDITGTLDYINNIFDECNINLDLLIMLNEKCKKRQNDNRFIYHLNYLSEQLRCYPFDGVSKYLTTYCNGIKNQYVLKIDSNTNKITTCKAEWFDLHVTYLTKRIAVIEKALAKRLKGAEADAEKEKKQQEKKERAVEQFDCECGGSYTRANKSHHFKTQEHIKWSTVCTECDDTDDDDDNTIESDDDDDNDSENSETKKSTVCECGGKYTYKNKATHLKSKWHKKWVENEAEDAI